MCLSVYPCSNRKTAWAINTKLGTRILYSSRSACIDPEVKRSKMKVTRLWKPSRCTVASDHGRYCVHLLAAVLPAAVAGVCLHVNTATVPMFSSFCSFYFTGLFPDWDGCLNTEPVKIGAVFYMLEALSCTQPMESLTWPHLNNMTSVPSLQTFRQCLKKNFLFSISFPDSILGYFELIPQFHWPEVIHVTQTTKCFFLFDWSIDLIVDWLMSPLPSETVTDTIQKLIAVVQSRRNERLDRHNAHFGGCIAKWVMYWMSWVWIVAGHTQKWRDGLWKNLYM